MTCLDLGAAPKAALYDVIAAAAAPVPTLNLLLQMH